MINLANKTALVTGSAKGIGAQIIRTLAQAGANVIINYRSEATFEAAKKLETEVREMGVEALVLQCDVSDYDAVGEMIKIIETTFGSLDIVVNNAGITKDGLFMRMKEVDFDAVLNANLKSTFNVSRQAIGTMIKKRSGNIINISSVVGITGNAGQVNYAASKAAMIGMTKSLAKEVANRNIKVNAIAPGFITSDMTDKLTEEQKNNILQYIPMKKMGTAEEVANVVLFLVSDLASYITGQTLSVDGGMYM